MQTGGQLLTSQGQHRRNYLRICEVPFGSGTRTEPDEVFPLGSGSGTRTKLELTQTSGYP